VRLLRFRYESCDPREFVSFWSQFYDEAKYPDKDYQRNLNETGLLDEKNILSLFEWKIG